MKTFAQLALAIGLLLSASAGALAVDLATAFGSGTVLSSHPEYCSLVATHAGVSSNTSLSLTANGTDSATINAQCLGVTVTTTFPAIVVNGAIISNVAFPKTVTASAPGIWSAQINGSSSSLLIVAQ